MQIRAASALQLPVPQAKKKHYEKARGEGRARDNDFSLVPS